MVKINLKETNKYLTNSILSEIGSHVLDSNSMIDIKAAFDNEIELFHAIYHLPNLNYLYLEEYNNVRGCYCYQMKNEYKLFLCLKDSFFDLTSNDINEYIKANPTYLCLNHTEKRNTINKIIYSKYDYVEYVVVKPNFNDCVLQTISSIKNYFGEKSVYQSNSTVDKYLHNHSYKHVAYLLLDGLSSYNVFTLLDEDSFLRKYYLRDMTAIYPSTTVSATTSARTGLTPLESGWTGWENYFKEMKLNMELFSGIASRSGEYTGTNAFAIMDQPNYFNSFRAKTGMLMPSFNPGGFSSFDDMLKDYCRITQTDERTFHYLYWTEPDATMHVKGSHGKEAKEIINNLSNSLAKYAAELKDTLLIISADHGHIDCHPIMSYYASELYDMLERDPSNDARCVTFKVKREYLTRFPEVFRRYFHGYYELYSAQEFIDNGYLGDPTIAKAHPRIADFMADYVAVGIADGYLEYIPKDIKFKSHHSGMTKNEMIIPLIIYGRCD